MYNDKPQSTVVKWWTFRLILEVGDMDSVHKGGGRNCQMWWRKTAAWKQLSAMLEEILAAVARTGEAGR